ncbi:unnamed protein product [Kuraishia capsulata CBS 1993]|uniref:histone acetyltransferase n=1 Tax=Kuraishia capsulata CBS 1993 TaxID=1382522 RepID=W6MJ14_9ASCO|nr:uncharacterized protein KUCA_T00000359001 [Kuraishia capsulata CBS 1993]CDK24397.1 unnamed protein product [Kuraishia capsulata CBS 1993]
MIMIANSVVDSHSGEDESLYGALDRRNIRTVSFGEFTFDTWYGNSVYFAANKPDMLGFKHVNEKLPAKKTSAKEVSEFLKTHEYWLDTLYVCPTCFKYTDSENSLAVHSKVCSYKSKLPGKLMYRDKAYSIRKVKGARHPVYCQCMCLFAKLFLDNKSVFFGLEYFDFFVVYGDVKGQQVPMGFFSKELLSWDGNNLACILVFPPFQRRKLGHLLIAFSYELSKSEGKVSGPEHPLSPFGKIGYVTFWAKTLARELLVGELSTVKDTTLEIISKTTGFRSDDIIMALDFMGALYTKGKKEQYLDYYPLPSEEGFIKVVDDNFKLLIVKEKIREWTISKKLTYTPVINVKNLLLY